MKQSILVALCCLNIGLLTGVERAEAQRATGFYNPYYVSGARIAPATLVPSLRKWYLPQRLYSLYDWRPEEYTNYARDLYQIYNPIFLEGVPHYDQYGNYITRGWQIYTWSEQYPRDNGSIIFKDPRFGSWFRNVVIAQSHSGQYHTSLMVGDGIRTSLTPLTFSKPRFDGVQWDFLSDKYGATLLASRVSQTGALQGSSGDAAVPANPFTNMYGFRGQAQVGDFAQVGFTFVNAAHRNSTLPFGDNSMKGLLSGPMNTDFVRSVIVRIADDSPEDGEGGALLSRWRIFVDGVEHTGDIVPTVEGGLRRRGVIEASGTDVITLTFNIEDFSAGLEDEIDDFRQIREVEIGLVLANDYKVEVTSNKQTNFLGTPVFLPVLRAAGNVKDGSNQGFHRFRYGLPTGNRLVGYSLDVENLAGFNLKSEYVRNFQYRRFPNENFRKDQALATNKSNAFYVTAQQRRYPWTVFGEVFSIDADYSTTAFIPNAQGGVFYDSETSSMYEFVDDNDDQDELADWSRRYFGPTVDTRSGRSLRSDNAVFPGLDEDNDDIPDFNRNFNGTPDYDEAFLRFEVDPPEFLFGMDMNNNTVIDRMEDDNEADYPYKRGHRGYNMYVGVEIFPGSDLMVGRLGEELLRTARESESNYLLLTLKKDYPERSLSVRVMVNPRKVKDDIPDDVFQWIDNESRFVRDQLIAQDAFANTTYLEVNYNHFLPFTTKVKHELYHRLDDEEGTRDQRFLGIINKGEFPLDLRNWTLMPRWKQLYNSTTPTRDDELKLQELTEIFSFMVQRDINRNIRFTAGSEYEIFANLRKKPDPLPPGYLEDSNIWILAAQVSNMSEYQGNAITTNVGVKWAQVDAAGAKSASELFSFITVYAGLGTDQ